MGFLPADASAGKPTEWPELVGQDANHAKEVIAAFGYKVFLVPEVRVTQLNKLCAMSRQAPSCHQMRPSAGRLHPSCWCTPAVLRVIIREVTSAHMLCTVPAAPMPMALAAMVRVVMCS